MEHLPMFFNKKRKLFWHCASAWIISCCCGLEGLINNEICTIMVGNFRASPVMHYLVTCFRYWLRYRHLEFKDEIYRCCLTDMFKHDGVIRLSRFQSCITEQIGTVSVKYLILIANEKGTASFGLFSSLRKNLSY